MPYCEHIFVSTFYKEDVVRRHLAQEEYFEKLILFKDEGLINIGGSLIKHRNTIFKLSPNNHLIVIPSDHVLKNFPLDKIYRFHEEHNSDLTLILTTHKSYGDYVVVDNQKKIRRLINSGKLPSYTGICLFKKAFLKKAILLAQKSQNRFDLTKTVILPAVNNSIAYGYFMPKTSYWDDAGTWFRYIKNNII